MSAPLVTVRGADLGYGRTTVLRGVKLELCERDFLGIVGPNGAGKSTLLKSILGIVPPLSGKVVYGSPRRELRFGYVPQRETVDVVFPLTALEVVLMSRYARMPVLKWPGGAERSRAREALEHVGIGHIADRLFRDLSGGQQQRVLIARALALDPRVLLLDEPTNGLDLESEHALMELIASFHSREAITVVMISHQLNVVVNYVRSLALVDRDRFLAGPIDEVLTETNLGRVYGTGVRIETVGGRRVVLPCSERHRA